MTLDITLDLSIVIGSTTDLPITEEAKMSGILDPSGLAWELSIISADRHPGRLAGYCEEARERGVKGWIGAAGRAARLPGAIAAYVQYMLPVIGVGLPSEEFPDALDALFSIARMPAGCPVAVAGIGSAGLRNAAIFAVQMLANKPERPFVSIVLGSERDFKVIEEAEMCNVLDFCKVDWERLDWSPVNFMEHWNGASKKGTGIFITSYRLTNLFKEITIDIQSAPLVISIPLPSDEFPDAKAEMEAIARLPTDYPVVSTGIGKASLRNAALFAVQILANGEDEKSRELKEKLKTYFHINRKEPQIGFRKSQRKKA